MKVKEAYELSIRMWKWLSENPTKDKDSWPHHEELIIDLTNECPLCECYYDYTQNHTSSTFGLYLSIMNCSNTCPLKIHKDDFECAGGLFDLWYNSKNKDFRQRIAKVILSIIEDAYKKKYKEK